LDLPELRRGFFFVPADGVALRFIDVVDWQGSSNSRIQSNMEVAWVSVEKACILCHQSASYCVRAPTRNRYRLAKQILLFSQLDIYFGARPKSLCRSQTKQSSAAANAKPT